MINYLNDEQSMPFLDKTRHQHKNQLVRCNERLHLFSRHYRNHPKNNEGIDCFEV